MSDVQPTSFCMGDFYHEPDTLCRGVSLDMPRLTTSDLLDQAGTLQRLKTWPQSPSSSQSHMCTSNLDDLPCKQRRFHQFHQGPQEVPKDSFFRLESTTILVVNSSAVTVGNKIIDFLEEQAIAVVQSVNLEKFSIKAEAYVNGSSVLLKVRIYKQGPSLAVEFQRRSGDAIAFHCIVHAAQEYVLACKSNFLAMPNLEVAPHRSNQNLVDSFAMLLELLTSTGPQLLADLAPQLLAAVTSLEEQRQAIPMILGSHALEVCWMMLQTDQFAICYPAACTLLQLSKLPEASQYLSAQMLQRILQKVWIKSTGPRVWMKLVEAVGGCLTQQTVNMNSEEAQKLASSLRSTVAGKVESSLGVEICRQLESSLRMTALLQ